ncbi:hypothetical protein BGZ61DRAFT_522230 [Ilyonectria robusta]|uniref:uncharacterized protein n=1 Tax=Ilyonectria robusta TaxID=1079257 RepID=UPI001E8EBB52|nr:uncharacterized protein BGZ61DRAFT_522230 [Ilyonectria robusta]KAH8667163.1 hypothetical protein BGZ61DRAFT_522230 [Ilyonectria robusta]
MAETNSESRLSQIQMQTLTACDLCHYRKVRCDRKDPCGRCTESIVQCLRTRLLIRTRKRRQRWMEHPTDTLTTHADQRLTQNSELETYLPRDEEHLDSPVPTPRTMLSPSNWALGQGETTSRLDLIDNIGLNVHQPQSQQSPNQSATASPWGRPTGSTLSHDTSSDKGERRESQIAAAFEAQAYMQSELQENQRIGHQQREILQLAIELSSQNASRNEGPVSDVDAPPTERADFLDPSMYPSSEAVCFLLSGSRTVAASFHSELSSIISRVTFERMAFALIDQQVHGHTRVQYIVCVNFIALTFAVGLEAEDQTRSIQERLKTLQDGYRRNAFTALRHVSILDPPSLPLLQTLLSGAILYQMAGSVDKCAQLSTAACVVCTHLGGRYFANLAAGASQAESLEVRQSLGHCYILDKSLAMTLGRRSFLPEMEVDAAMLIPPAVEKPSAPIFNVYIEFAKIQDSIARDMRAHHPGTSSKRLEAVNSLRKRMKDIRVKIREFRLQPPHCTEHLLQGEWMGVDFTYFTIMTTIIRLHPDFSTNEHVREDCLENARRSLSELKNMENHGFKSGKYRNAYCYSVAWIVLLYPLCPFFTLFCHVVETGNESDFQLLKEVADGLSMFAEYIASVGNLQKLCNTLISLCTTHLDALIDVPNSC